MTTYCLYLTPVLPGDLDNLFSGTRNYLDWGGLHTTLINFDAKPLDGEIPTILDLLDGHPFDLTVQRTIQSGNLFYVPIQSTLLDDIISYLGSRGYQAKRNLHLTLGNTTEIRSLDPDGTIRREVEGLLRLVTWELLIATKTSRPRLVTWAEPFAIFPEVSGL